MKIRLLFILLAIAPYSLFAQSNEKELFVNQSWLLENLSDENLVLLHVGAIEDYDTGHIKGAQLITSQEFSTVRGQIRWEIPDLESFREELMNRGITNETTNILYYGSGQFASTFRLYFTMKYFGLADNTFILDGGMPGWIAKNQKIETRANKGPASADLFLYPNEDLIVSRDDIIALDSPRTTTIIDARNNNFYTGEEDGDGYYKRSGHLPGAVNITWTQLVDNNRFIKSESELRKLFDEAGVGENEDVITYCHVGLRATVLHAIATMLGHESRLYDGSYNEWDTLSDEYPVETGN